MRRMVPRASLPGQAGMCTHVYMNVRELRANLAAAVRQAEAGQRVVITVGGRAVAQLGPLAAARGRAASRRSTISPREGWW